MQGTATLGDGGSGTRPAGRCPDCTEVACALHHICAGSGARRAWAEKGTGRGLSISLWWTRLTTRPLFRYRAPTALALAATLVVAWIARPSGALHLTGYVCSAGLALWWSAPRAGRPGWAAVLAVAIAVGLTVWSGGTGWPLPAVALALLTARRTAAFAPIAWAPSAASILAAGLFGGHMPPWDALLGSALGAALGAIVGERRRYAAREQDLLVALADAQARMGHAESLPTQAAAAHQDPAPGAGGAPSATKPPESACADSGNRR